MKDKDPEPGRPSNEVISYAMWASMRAFLETVAPDVPHMKRHLDELMPVLEGKLGGTDALHDPDLTKDWSDNEVHAVQCVSEKLVGMFNALDQRFRRIEGQRNPEKRDANQLLMDLIQDLLDPKRKRDEQD